MTPLCVIGLGRLARALALIDNDIIPLSAREAGYVRQAARAAAEGADILVTARDPKQSPDVNVKLLHRIAADLASAGVSSDRIYFAGSYTVENPSEGTYRCEKRALEQAVCSGGLAGRVLRLPIVRLGDSRQRAILAGLAAAIAGDRVDGSLRLALIGPERLRSLLGRLPADCRSVEIVSADLVTISDLIAEWQIPPAPRPVDEDALAPFIVYTERIKAGESVRTHYEEQAARACLR